MTVSQDTLRTGWDQSETTLDPASVTASDFGQQFATTLDGEVYAQPLVVGNMLIAVTDNDKVYGLDKASGAIQWTDNVGPAWPAATIGCSDLTPNIGITATPVYDSVSGAVYFVSKTNNGVDAMHPNYYMHAVDPNTGAEKTGFPVLIGGHPSNDAAATFDPAYQGQRAGLLLLNGVVYAAFGSHCDFGSDYRGYVVGVSTAGKQTALWSDETGTGIKGAGIWAAGGGLVSDGAGQIIFATGNGVSPAPGPGSSPPGDLAESVVRLRVNADGSLTPTDFFSPSNATTMDANDTDFGSGGPMGLPDSYGTTTHPHLLVQMGKDGRLFLLDRDNLGGRSQGAGGTDADLGMVGPYQGQWGHPAFWGGDGGYVYLVGNGGPLRAFKVGVSGSGNPALTLVGTSAGTFNYTSGSPVVTSNGTTSGTGVVWVVYSTGPTGATAELRAYSATPNGSGTLTELWSAPIGTAVKFTTPATSDGHVYVGTRDGKILAFGRPSSSALTGSPVSFGNVPVSTTGNATLTVTAAQAVTVTAVSATSPFSATPPTLPVSMNTGDTLSIPMTFTPGGTGTITGTVSLSTNSGTVSFTASGYGTKPGLGATPPNAVFNDQPVGLSTTSNIQITNTGTSTETISATTAPSAPFAVTGLPAAGATVAAGGSFIASVTYTPTAATGTGANTDSFTVTSTSPDDPNTHNLTVSLTGTAVVAVKNLNITPWPLTFGSVPLGASVTQNFSITNTGNVPVTVTKAKAPDSDFTSASPLPEGQVIGPGQTYIQPVTFTPTTVGAETAQYELTSDDGQGARYLPITGTAIGTQPAVPTGWQLNGAATATASTGTIQLTPATAQQVAGSAFATTPVSTNNLAASFTAQLNGGTGADGLTFSLIDSTKNAPTALGGSGGGLGLDGLSGIGVVLDTFYNAQANSANYVAIATGVDNGSGAVTYLSTAPVPASLRTGTHTVTVTVISGVITVYVDATQLLSYTPAAGLIPPTAYAGFTAGNGAQTDLHAVSKIAIASAPASATVTAPTVSPTSVSFTGEPAGFHSLTAVTITNSGSVPVVVTGVTVPTGELGATQVPAVGTVISAGGSITVNVTFVPTVLSKVNGSLVVTTTAGTLTVPITGATWPLPGVTHTVKFH